MKTNLLLSFFLFLIPFLSFSQTSVSGNIQTNTTWTKAASPYILNGTVGVPSAYTLTIEPGVTIQRTGDYQILINGAVIINGSQTDSIVFNSGPVLNQFNKPFIEFQKSNLDNSSLRFVKFINQSTNGNNIRMGNETEFAQTSPKNSGTLKIARSNLSNGYTATKGYHAANAMNIDSSVIASANVMGYYPNSEKINITNSLINGSAILSDSYNLGIFFTNCNITATTFTIACCGANFNFTNSTVRNSSINQNNDYGTVNIQNSIFLNTPINIPNTVLNINNSKYVITDKNLAGYHTANNVKFAIATARAAFTGSEFIGLNNLGVVYNSNYINYNGISFINNTFNNFSDGVEIQDFSSIVFNSNNFFNSGRYDIINYSTKDFSATNNYYELKQGQTIDDVIFDSNDDLTYGLVNYNPYSTTSVAAAAISQPKNVTKEQSGSSITVRWKKNTETNLKNYKVYWGYVDPFTYSNVVTVAASDSTLVLNGSLITDSIAVTAVSTSATGSNDQQAGYESWYSPAILTAAVLPVRLITFSAVNAGTTNYLSWRTSSEVDNDHFDVEYSVDGNSFSKIGSISGKSNETGNTDYSFVHRFPAAGYSYYRLKQVDKDGLFQYSNTVHVKSDVAKRLAIYPNPTTATINIISSTPIVSASILNEFGQPIERVNGNNRLQMNINVTQLPVGVYRVMIVDEKRECNNVSFIKQ